MACSILSSVSPAGVKRYFRVPLKNAPSQADADLVTENPAAGIDRPSPATEGHQTWTIEEVRRYQKTHPTGGRARLAMDLLLYTGLRRGDVVMQGKQHVRNGIISYRASKTGVEVVLPMLPEL